MIHPFDSANSQFDMPIFSTVTYQPFITLGNSSTNSTTLANEMFLSFIDSFWKVQGNLYKQQTMAKILERRKLVNNLDLIAVMIGPA